MAIWRGDFEPITESGPLVAELRQRIESEGAITFREFMAAALYHPKYGYYMNADRPMSRSGDYLTSPEVHSIFGSLMAKQLLELWQVMGKPAKFDIVEQGAGSGLLARDILAWSEREADFAAAIRYGMVEVSAASATMQRETLADCTLIENVSSHDAVPSAICGCVISNELVDAFPVHRVVRIEDELHEVFVALKDGRFVDELRPLSDDALRTYFDDLGVLPGDGCYAEVNLDAPRWISAVGRSLDRGYVLTLDYGYEASQLYAPWRRDGTLLCVYRQSASSDPYHRVGKQDMTASVDFTTLRRAGEGAGLQTLAITDQSQFLVRLGIGEAITAVAGEAGAQIDEYFARRRVVMDLIDPAKLGRVKVLLQGKGVPAARLRGFTDG